MGLSHVFDVCMALVHPFLSVTMASATQQVAVVRVVLAEAVLNHCRAQCGVQPVYTAAAAADKATPCHCGGRERVEAMAEDATGGMCAARASVLLR